MAKDYLVIYTTGDESERKELRLKFNVGTLKHLQRITGGIDPFSFVVGLEIDKMIKHASMIIQAALLSNYTSKKKDVDFTDADVELWTEDLSMDTLVEVVNTFRTAYSVEPSGEGGEDTRA